MYIPCASWVLTVSGCVCDLASYLFILLSTFRTLFGYNNPLLACRTASSWFDRLCVMSPVPPVDLGLYNLVTYNTQHGSSFLSGFIILYNFLSIWWYGVIFINHLLVWRKSFQLNLWYIGVSFPPFRYSNPTNCVWNTLIYHMKSACPCMHASMVTWLWFAFKLKGSRKVFSCLVII